LDLTSIISDKGQDFVSYLFAYISKILGITHVTSGAVSPKRNGGGEEVVKRLSERLKRFATPAIDDRNIEDILPLIELLLRTTCSKNMRITAYEIVHGFQAQLPSSLTTEVMHYFQTRMHKIMQRGSKTQ